jgi:hypothetical protein
MVFAFVIALAVVDMPQAQAYDTYLNGDTNYVLVYGHQGVSWYLDKSSVVIKQSDRQANAFACNIVIVDTNGNISGTKTYWYDEPCQRDNYNEACYSVNGTDWKVFNVNDTAGYMQVVVNGFKTGWKAAFGSGWS